MNLSLATRERLVTSGVDLGLLDALVDAGALRRINEQAFQVPCRCADGSEESWHVALDDSPEPWLRGDHPAAWFPVGEEGSTAVVVVGLEPGLALASLLFHVTDDGAIRRRANLPGVLADAFPVVLPETLREVAVEWVISDEAPYELLDQLAAAGCALAFLALPVEPMIYSSAEIPIRDFANVCADAAPDGLTVAPVLLPGGVRLTDPVLAFHGHGRRYAVAGILAFWHAIALHPPATNEEDE